MYIYIYIYYRSPGIPVLTLVRGTQFSSKGREKLSIPPDRLLTRFCTQDSVSRFEFTRFHSNTCLIWSYVLFMEQVLEKDQVNLQNLEESRKPRFFELPSHCHALGSVRHRNGNRGYRAGMSATHVRRFVRSLLPTKGFDQRGGGRIRRTGPLCALRRRRRRRVACS